MSVSRLECTKCDRMVYFYSHKSGNKYCSEHQCVMLGCNRCVCQESSCKLCSYHNNELIFCKYIEDGVQCKNVVGKMDVGFDVELPEPYQRARFFCQEHICRVSGCTRRIRNKDSLWCSNHSVPCKYIRRKINPDDYVEITVCDKFVLKKCDSEEENEKNVYCGKHRCHWNMDKLEQNDDKCYECVEETDDCPLYCKKHYQIYKFKKFEYVN